MAKSKHLHIRVEEKDLFQWRRAARLVKVDLTKWVTVNNNVEAAIIIHDRTNKSKAKNTAAAS